MRNRKRLAVVMPALTLFCALLIGLAGCGSAAASAASSDAASGGAGSGSGNDRTPEITVSASASVSLVPDKATVTFGVSTQARTAEEAQNQNTEAVNAVIETLTGRGIEERSIRTVNYSIYPQYDYSANGDQRIIGYNVNTSMSVQDQDIDELGELLAACVAAGINNVDSVQLLCSGYDEAYQEALSQAVEASRGKAEALAQAAGRSLGGVITITEGWQDSSARYVAAEEAAAYGANASMDAGPSIQPGETEIRANVTVTYAMN